MQSRIIWNWRGLALAALMASAAYAAPKYTFEQAANVPALPVQISNTDLINGLPAGSILLNYDLATGWPNNTNGYEPLSDMQIDGVALSPCLSTERLLSAGARHTTASGFHDGVHPDPVAQKVKLVDGLQGINTDTVLADYFWPAAVIQFDLDAKAPAGPKTIGEIRVFAANADVDGRVFQNYDVEISTDTNPDTKQRVFAPLINRVITSIIVCAGGGFGDGFAPNLNDGSIGATVTRVFDDTSPTLATGVTSVRFRFWAVSNTQKVFRDQWLGPIGCAAPPEGANPAEYYDVQDQDGVHRTIESSVIKEIDILETRDGAFEICDNGLDDDGDTLIDGADRDCFGLSCPPEDCGNAQDDTGDSLVDCDDPDCLGEPICTAEICDNGLDDDGDLLVDCADSDCASLPVCCPDPVFDVAGGGEANDQPDGAVDLMDFAVFQRCISSGGGDFNSLSQVCRCMDKTGPGGTPDQVIDGNDLGILLLCNTGPAPATPVSPACDD